MSHNTFGHLFRVTTWGESHGPAIGCVVDGCPPGIRFTTAEIQAYLDRRAARPVALRHPAPGAGRGENPVRRVRGRRADAVTTGTPISLMIDNVDQRSKDYGEIATYRPGHADYTYLDQIRRARLSRRRAVVGARDGGARCRRRYGAQVVPGHHGSRRAGADRAASRSTAATGTGT